MKKIYVDVCRCELSLLEGEKLISYLKKNEYKIVKKPKDAEIIIYIACAAFNAIERNSLMKVKNYVKNYNAELIVAGCLPAIAPEKLKEIFNGKTTCVKEILANPEKMDDLFHVNKYKYDSIKDGNFVCRDFSPGVSSKKSVEEIKNFFKKSILLNKNYFRVKNHILKNLYGDRSLVLRSLFITVTPKLYHITICRGCLGNCSYCVIKKAIGGLKSKPFNQCINDFKEGLSLGYKNFVINADDSGAYGLDIGTNLPALLNEIIKIPGDYEIEIRNLHPQWLVKYIDDLEDIIKSKKIKLIDCHIQSGVSRILKLMRRYSDIDKIEDAFLRLRKIYPDLKLYTSYITGFPTETDEEFKKIMELFKKISFNSGFIFAFNCRYATDAEHIEPKVPEKELYNRVVSAEKILKKAKYKIFRVSQPNQPHFLIFNRRY